MTVMPMTMRALHASASLAEASFSAFPRLLQVVFAQNHHVSKYDYDEARCMLDGSCTLPPPLLGLGCLYWLVCCRWVLLWCTGSALPDPSGEFHGLPPDCSTTFEWPTVIAHLLPMQSLNSAIPQT